MSKYINFCRPLISENVNDLISRIQETSSQYHYFEIWIDYLSNLDKESFNSVIEADDKEFIIVTRRKDLEEPKLPKNKRLEILEYSIEKGVIIDCDLRQREELDFLISKKYDKILLSYHNYDNTPGNLDDIYREMQAYNPFIYKFACFCNTLNDAINLLQVGLMLKSKGSKSIVTGIGEKGKIVRLASAAWFNEFNFAPVNVDENTASGQLTIKQLIEALNILEMEE